MSPSTELIAVNEVEVADAVSKVSKELVDAPGIMMESDCCDWPSLVLVVRKRFQEWSSMERKLPSASVMYTISGSKGWVGERAKWQPHRRVFMQSKRSNHRVRISVLNISLLESMYCSQHARHRHRTAQFWDREASRSVA